MWPVSDLSQPHRSYLKYNHHGLQNCCSKIVTGYPIPKIKRMMIAKSKLHYTSNRRELHIKQIMSAKLSSHKRHFSSKPDISEHFFNADFSNAWYRHCYINKLVIAYFRMTPNCQVTENFMMKLNCILAPSRFITSYLNATFIITYGNRRLSKPDMVVYCIPKIKLQMS